MISNMAVILAIETTTKNCSVALFQDGKELSCHEKLSQDYTHAEKLTVYIQELMKQIKLSFNDLDAIAISQGPGSYTGLRIGTSVAKGLCYSLEIPLISIPTLKGMAYQASVSEEYDLFCPMLDARRMEVFAAIYDKDNQEIRAVEADIVHKETYDDYLHNKILFFGDGALKCREVISHKNAHFLNDIYPSARNVGVLANDKFIKKDFEDIAYFEPFYLKDFVAGKKN